MNNRNKTRNLFYIKLILYSLVMALSLSSCEQTSNNNVSLNDKFIDIYKMDIKMKLADLKDLTANNEMKYKSSYIETLVIQSKFDSIYSLIEENNLNIYPLLKEISTLTKKNYRYKTAKKIEIILNTNITAIDKKELQSILLELNSSIITQLRYDIDLTNLKVNRISILVAPEEKEVKLGEIYKARIIIAAVDSTNPPYIAYRNQTIKMTDGVGHLQIKAEKKGINESMGIVNLKSTEDGIKRQFLFKFEFNVK
jgi:hypothetical protein